MTNFVEEPTKQTFDTGFDIINSNESESDLTEEDYWYSVEQLDRRTIRRRTIRRRTIRRRIKRL